MITTTDTLLETLIKSKVGKIFSRRFGGHAESKTAAFLCSIKLSDL